MATPVTQNTAAVTFPAQTAGGNVVECALFVDVSGGVQITDWKALTAGTVALSAGQQFRIPAGDYDIALTGAFTDAYTAVVLDAYFHDAATLHVGYSASAGTECADATYARQDIAFDAAA